jgi:hypothetical protein
MEVRVTGHNFENLRWSTAKIVFSDPDLGPKWPLSADIVLA